MTLKIKMANHSKFRGKITQKTSNFLQQSYITSFKKISGHCANLKRNPKNKKPPIILKHLQIPKIIKNLIMIKNKFKLKLKSRRRSSRTKPKTHMLLLLLSKQYLKKFLKRKKTIFMKILC